MAAFTHLNPDGSRFTDGTCGVFYAANILDTAIGAHPSGAARVGWPLLRNSWGPISATTA
ncbi:RES domain-containing protein [uncultured Ferrovibrio sp.]|jgi:hypothetical protein|uniref:RES domain-containing protein n=1 Tax=uncultured Ferrovibrio sp. TaxID=1576913 RepID=UPI00343C2FA0